MNNEQVKRKVANCLRHLDKRNIMKNRLRSRRDRNARERLRLRKLSCENCKKRAFVRTRIGNISKKEKRKFKNNRKLAVEVNTQLTHSINNLAKGNRLIKISKGYSFVQLLISQLLPIDFIKAETEVLERIAIESKNITKVIAGEMQSNVKFQFIESPNEPKVSTPLPFFKRMPPSEWVYSTPDKQRLKNMNELNLDTTLPTTLQPAVLQNSLDSKTIYSVNEDNQNSIGVQYSDSDEVPIDLDYLKPECRMVVGCNNATFNEDSNDDNNFLSGEVTLDSENNASLYVDARLTPKSRKRSHPEYTDDGESNWYEKEMKIMATCKPSKPKLSYRASTSLRKSLSFQDQTPTSRNRYIRPYRSFGFGENDISHADSANCSGQTQDFDDSLMDCSELSNNEQSFSNLSLILDNVNINKIDDLCRGGFTPKNN